MLIKERNIIRSGNKMIKLKNILMEYSVDSSGKETLKSQLDIIEKGLRQITSAPVSISDKNGTEFRAKWSHMKGEMPTSVWKRVLEFIEEEHGTVDIKKSSNYYEQNWEPEEPAEAVPTIYFTLEPEEKKSKFKTAGERSGFDMRGLK
tara:strand:+ start:504 stop:947 length:444 start_codon:yes stop_codon:yes gene_type:complete